MKFFCPVLALFLAVFFLAPSQSFAEYDKEMQYLHMYFSEDELVVSATRALKPLSEVAENITVVTAEEIKNMNAHTIAEVLEYVTGVYVGFQGHDFGGTSLLNVQGAEPRHVLFLVDGVVWNSLNSGETTSNALPVEIIKNIEIIKGPASSVWGSSLGGIINVVTKDAGTGPNIEGTARASYGKSNSGDYSADAFGTAGRTGYYIFAGRQASDGLKNDREYKRNSYYSKFEVPLANGSDVVFTAGYSEPFNDYGVTGYDSTGDTADLFTTMLYNTEASDKVDLEAALSYHKWRYEQDTESTTSSYARLAVYEEETLTGGIKLIYSGNVHTVVAGMDASSSELEQRVEYYTDPLLTETNPDLQKYAIYLNDTISLGSLTITPGIRYDNNNISDEFLSPSIGVVQRVSESTILRASVAKGFTSPPLSYLSGGGFKLDPNPSLDPEVTWSYQAGIESIISNALRAKINFFYHDQKDAFVKETVDVGPPKIKMYFNIENLSRKGVEAEFITVPVLNMTLRAGAAYFFIENHTDDITEDKYIVHATLTYNDRKSFMAQLSGSYIYWDPDEYPSAEDGILSDLNLRKKIELADKNDSEVFFTAHNIFNLSHYSSTSFENPGQWAEGGVRFSF